MLREKVRKARKKHWCKGCLGDIEKGDRYHFSAWVDQREISEVKLCAKCHYVWTHASYNDDLWGEGELKEDHHEVPGGYEIPELS